MKKRIIASLLLAVFLITSMLSGCGDNSATETAEAQGYGEQVALVRLGEEPESLGMQFTLDGMDYDPTVGKLTGREYYKIDAKTAELKLKLDKDAAEKLEGKDIFFKLEYNESSSKELKLEFTSKAGKSEAAVKMRGTSSWGGSSVKIESFKYSEDSEYDFKVSMGTASQLWLHSVSVVAADKREAAYPMFVESEYASSNKAVITGNVLDYGAVGDGKTDDTVAFMTALSAMEDIGGTLYVPKGTYLITQSITIPRGLSLLGDFNAPTADNKKVDGTVLALDPATVADGNENAAIGMHSGTNMNGFSIWYPSQTLENGIIKEYPYAIKNIHNGASVTENLYLVNVYNGIDHGSVTNQNQSMVNIYGTPLNTGGYISDANEVGRNEAINFSPEYWLQSGLAGVPDEKILRSYLKEYATGFYIDHVDWHYLSDINISGYNIGVKIGSFFGRVYDMNVTDCETCVYVEAVTYYGGQLTNGILKASGSKNAAALRIGEECGANGITCASMHFESEGDYAVYHAGEAPMSIQDSYIKSASTGVYAKLGRISLINTELDGAATALLLDEGAGKSTVVNCTAENGGKFESKVSENLTVTTDENLKSVLLDKEKLDEVQTAGAKKYDRKNTEKLVNAADYGLSADAEDNAKALQDAIDAAAGGTVYIPAGKYRLESPVTVKKNVTLLGSCDTFHSAIDSAVTYFVTDYGKNQPDSALFTLEEGAAARGFSVSYDKIPQACEIPYGWTFRGMGKDITFANIVVTGGFNVADFETNKCDNHYIENIAFVAYDTGIAVSGENGVMRWCTNNPATYWDNPFSEEKNWDSSWSGVLQTALRAKSTAYRVTDTKNEIMMLCMVFGVNKGVHVRGTSELYLIGQGVDYSMCSLYAENSANIICTDLQGVGAPGDSSCITADKNFTGTLSAYSTTSWSVYGDVVKANGGNVNIIGGVFFQCGNSALNQTGGNVIMNGVITVRRNRSDITATAGTLSAFGNIVTARIPKFDIASAVEYFGDDIKQ